MASVGAAGSGAIPQYVFELVYNEEGDREDLLKDHVEKEGPTSSEGPVIPVTAPAPHCVPNSPPQSATPSHASTQPVSPLTSSFGVSCTALSSVSLEDPSSSLPESSTTTQQQQPIVKLPYPFLSNNRSEAILQDVLKNRNARFDTLLRSYDKIVGYHASSLENFHSIVRNGLDVKYSEKKAGLFGNGIYLSTDAGVCMSFIEYGMNWPKSCLGRRIGMMVGCEVVQDPESVKKGTTQGHGDNPMPEQYILSTSNDCVRAKYVLVLAEGQPRRQEEKKQPLISKNMYIIIAFLLLLALVAFLRSGYWRRLKHRYGLY